MRRGEKRAVAMARREHTWLPAKPKSPPRPKMTDDVRTAVDAQAAPVVARLKRRICSKPKKGPLNWPDDVLVRWHRDSLYFVVVMRTPHGRPPTFETHTARMEHIGDGKFNLAVPMRRGWNTIKKDASPEQCLKEISEFVSF